MTKKNYFTVVLLLGAFLFSIESSTAKIIEPDCNSSTPNVNCPIWNVKTVAGPSGNSITCSTGGKYKCAVSTEE